MLDIVIQAVWNWEKKKTVAQWHHYYVVSYGPLIHALRTRSKELITLEYSRSKLIDKYNQSKQFKQVEDAKRPETASG